MAIPAAFLPSLAATSILAAAAARTIRDLHLPAALAGYRGWSPLTTERRAVPLQLFISCMSPTDADWARARLKTGPHTRHYIQVYGNDAARALGGAQRLPLPVGAIVAKAKFTDDHGEAVGVAFMIKRDSPAFRQSGGWEFVYYPSSDDARRVHDACAACHRQAASTDYVFGTYPR